MKDAHTLITSAISTVNTVPDDKYNLDNLKDEVKNVVKTQPGMKIGPGMKILRLALSGLQVRFDFFLN